MLLNQCQSNQIEFIIHPSTDSQQFVLESNLEKNNNFQMMTMFKLLLCKFV